SASSAAGSSTSAAAASTSAVSGSSAVGSEASASSASASSAAGSSTSAAAASTSAVSGSSALASAFTVSASAASASAAFTLTEPLPTNRPFRPSPRRQTPSPPGRRRNRNPGYRLGFRLAFRLWLWRFIGDVIFAAQTLGIVAALRRQNDVHHSADEHESRC